MVLLITGVLLIVAGTAGGVMLSRLLSDHSLGFGGQSPRSERSGTKERHGTQTLVELPPEFTAPCSSRNDPRSVDKAEHGVIDPRALEPSDRPLVKITQSNVEFRSADGLQIPGLLMAPATGGPYPGVVWVHGGIGDQVEPQVIEAIARNGYVALGVDYRGSSGHGGNLQAHTDIAQKDVDDVIAGGHYLAGLPNVDADRLVVGGGSRGAAMALLAVIREPGLFHAVGAFYPVVDWACALMQGGQVGEAFIEAFGGTPEEVPRAYIERSPYYLADRIRVPVYMAAGLRDRHPPPSEMLKMAEALESNGQRPVTRLYSGLGHGFLLRESADSPLWEDFFRFLDRTL